MNRDWMDHAACAKHPLAYTWIEENARTVPAHIRKTCGACPVKQECLQDELDYAAQTYRWTYRPAGYRAGLTPTRVRQKVYEYLQAHPVKGEGNETGLPG